MKNADFPPYDTKKSNIFISLLNNVLQTKNLTEYELVCNSLNFCHYVVMRMRKVQTPT